MAGHEERQQCPQPVLPFAWRINLYPCLLPSFSVLSIFALRLFFPSFHRLLFFCFVFFSLSSLCLTVYPITSFSHTFHLRFLGLSFASLFLLHAPFLAVIGTCTKCWACVCVRERVLVLTSARARCKGCVVTGGSAWLTKTEKFTREGGHNTSSSRYKGDSEEQLSAHFLVAPPTSPLISLQRTPPPAPDTLVVMRSSLSFPPLCFIPSPLVPLTIPPLVTGFDRMRLL